MAETDSATSIGHGRGFVDEDDGSGLEMVADAPGDESHVGAHAVETACAPHHDAQAQRAGDHGQEDVVMAGGRAEKTRRMLRADGGERFLAGGDLPPQAGRAQRPKKRGGMSLRVIADLMAARDDFAHESGMPRGTLADEEKDGLQAMTVEDVEDRGRVLRVRAVVDGEQRVV
jgi:hypothetical protein